jgi:IS30 family transposase
LSADQQARISELHAERLSPSTIAMYVGKPREMVEAYLQRERDRTYRRS